VKKFSDPGDEGGKKTLTLSARGKKNKKKNKKKSTELGS